MRQLNHVAIVCALLVGGTVAAAPRDQPRLKLQIASPRATNVDVKSFLKVSRIVLVHFIGPSVNRETFDSGILDK